MSKMKLEMVLKATDKASPAIKKLAEQIAQANQRTARASEARAKTEQTANRRAADSLRRVNAARSRLGVRSERVIQREIRRTQAAYNRLARSGKASANEVSRAYTAMINKVTRLNRELNTTATRQSKLGKMRGVGTAIAGVTAGAIAGGMMLAAPAKRQMTYDRHLSMVANTAFSNRGVKGRIEGKAELAAAVKKAVDTGGGKKEDALGALDTLLASGAVNTQTAMNLLPTLQKGGVATGASTEDLAKIAISSMQQFGIGEKDIGKVLDMAVAAGQAGNFELADMARWLPQQMAAAKSAGLSGIDGLEALLVANQQARVTAGSSDEAGNNLVNLLAKITSKETGERFAKINYSDKDGKVKGIDYVGSMEKGKKEGKNSIQAFLSIMDKVIGNDARYQKLQKQLKTADKSEQKQLIAQMTKLVEGTAIGKIVSDRQALMALLGIRNNVALGEDVKTQVQNSDGAVGVSHQVIAATNDFKVEKAANKFKEGQDSFMEGINDFLGDAASLFSNWAKENPTANKVGSGAVTLASAAAASGGTYALGKKVLTRGTTAATAEAVAGAGGASTALASIAKGIAKASSLATVLLLGGSSDNSQQTRDHYAQKRQKDLDYLSRMINSLEVYKGKLAMPDRALQYKKDLAAHPDSPQKQELAVKLDGLLQQSKIAINDGILAKTPSLNEQISMLNAELNARTELTNTAIHAMANQPIVIHSTNQVHVDGAMVSETVSRHQANRLSRGEN